MNDRLVTAGCALAVCALFYALFVQSQAEPLVTRPLSTEPGDAGYLGLRTWLEGEGVRVLSMQRRLDSLGNEAPPLVAGGNVLLTTWPHRYPLRAAEYVALQQWLERGNTLFVLAALDETPHWTSSAAKRRSIADLGRLTGLDFEARSEDGTDGPFLGSSMPVEAGSTLELTPAAEHPLLDGVDALYGYSDLPSSLWQPQPLAAGGASVLRLVNESTSGNAAMWQPGALWRVGATDSQPSTIDGAPPQRGYVGGAVVVSASASLFANRNIGDGDTRRFVANLLEHHLGPGGALIFDDMHQGLTTLYDRRAFYADPRLHATLAFLVAAWLAWILGSSNRLAAPRPVVAEPRQRDFLAAAGGFMARRLDRCAAGLMLMNEWFDEIRHRRGLPASAAPPWTELEATPALDRVLYRELREAHERLENGRPVGMLRLHNVLQQAREAIG